MKARLREWRQMFSGQSRLSPDDAYGIAMRRQRYERVHRPRSEDGDDRVPDLEDAK